MARKNMFVKPVRACVRVCMLARDVDVKLRQGRDAWGCGATQIRARRGGAGSEFVGMATDESTRVVADQSKKRLRRIRVCGDGGGSERTCGGRSEQEEVVADHVDVDAANQSARVLADQSKKRCWRIRFVGRAADGSRTGLRRIRACGWFCGASEHRQH
eukprot:365846-Chlamydomonas_euryale.AAC.9